MNSAMSWSVKGIEPEVREAAKAAARRSGQTMGQWLKTMILDSSERPSNDTDAERFIPHRSVAGHDTDPVQNRINQLEQNLSTLTREQSETTVGRRLGPANGNGLGDATLQHILDRIERNEQATLRTMEVVEERVGTIAKELGDARERSFEPPAAWAEPEAIERALENVVDHIESADKETRDTLADLHGKLEALSAEVASGPSSAETANRKILSDVEHRLTALAHRVDQVAEVDHQQLKHDFDSKLSELTKQVGRIAQAAPDDLKETLERRLADLANRIESAEQVSSQVRTDLDSKVENRLQHLTDRLEAIGRETEHTASQAATAAVQTATDDFREIEAKVQQLAAQIQEAPGEDPEIMGSVSNLTEQMSSLTRDVQQIKLEAASEQDINSLRAMFDTLSSSVDQRLTEASSEPAIARLEQQLGEFGQRLEQADRPGEPDAKIGELEQRLHDIDGRLAAAPSETPNDGAVETLGTQLGELSQRVANAEQQYSGIQTIESSIAQLFESMEQTRAFATEVAEQSAAGVAEKLKTEQGSPESSATLDALDNGLQALKTSAATADKHNQETLEAVHDTLEKVISRLAALEQMPADPLQDAVPALADDAAEPGASDSEAAGLTDVRLPPIPPAPSSQDFTAEPAGDGDEGAAWEAGIDAETVEAADETFAEDMSDTLLLDSAPKPQAEPSLVGLVNKGDTSTRGDFIAAARNAAQVVAEDPEMDAAGTAKKGRRGKRRGKKAKQAGEAKGSGRRPLVLAAIVLLMIGAVSAYTMVSKKATPGQPDQATAPSEMQLMSPAQDEITPTKTPVAAPNDQQSQKSDQISPTDTQITGRSDQEPLNAQIPVPTAGKQSLEPIAEPAAPRSPEMAGAKQDLTTGSIKPADQSIVDQVIAPTDPLLLAVPGITPPEPSPPDSQSAPVTASTTAPETTGSTNISQTPSAPVSKPVVPNVKNLPPSEVGPMGLRVAAAAGDPVAQFLVATKYTEGGSIKQDFRKAARWYQKAAARGLAPAQYRLATFYEKGKGVPQDLAAARIWYERAAEKGNRKAMHNLAVIYADGSRGTPDFNKAGIWFRNAAELGLKDSQYNLGILHERGLGVPKDLGQAYKWFALAARQGDPDAETRMIKIESRLTQQALVEAKLDVRAWSAKEIDMQANVVTPTASDWQSPTAATNSTSLSNAELITEAQNLLNRLGYSAGRADGLMGNRTREAIRTFQKANDIPQTGAVTPNLLTALRQKAG